MCVFACVRVVCVCNSLMYARVGVRFVCVCVRLCGRLCVRLLCVHLCWRGLSHCDGVVRCLVVCV